MIVAFHPALKLDRITIYRSFVYSIKQLTSLDYFSWEQITFIEPHLINMLKDMAFEVSKRKCKNSVGQMFSTESTLVKKTLLKWFNAEFNCVICKFPMKLEPTNYMTPDNEVTFVDFMIRYEHKFLRNVYTTEKIEQSDHIKHLESYYEIFKDYIMICIGLIALLSNFSSTILKI